MGIESRLVLRYGILDGGLQKESPSMGIERSPFLSLKHAFKFFPCKKSPQAWGLKVDMLPPFAGTRMPCKKSPQAWGLKVGFYKTGVGTTLELAKRVPKHGD